MKQYFKFLITVLLITFLLFAGTIYGILVQRKGVFHDSYASVIQDKYDILVNTDGPKIIVISGSSSAFGLDQQLLSDAAGMPVVNLGLHAGFGPCFPTELAKANIGEGDIVLLGYENGWQDMRNQGDPLLCLMGADSRLDMYRTLSFETDIRLLGFITDFAERKANYDRLDITDYYNRYVFDPETFQMIKPRPDPMEYNPDIHGYYAMDNYYSEITDETIDYLRAFKAYAESRGASVYFVIPPVAESSIFFDYNLLVELMQTEEEVIGIPCISDPWDYVFPDELMSNSMYHCNSAGEVRRTEILIEDLRGAGVIR